MNNLRAFAIDHVDATAGSIAFQGAVDAAEVESAAAGVSPHGPGYVTDLDSSSGGVELSIELRRHGNGVAGFVLILAKGKPGLVQVFFVPASNRDRVTILVKSNRAVVQVFF